MKQLGVLILVILAFQCKKKAKGVDDPAWKIESLQMAGFFCETMKKCYDEKKPEIDPSLEKYAATKMYTANCLEIHKKSNVFHLRQYNPELIKSSARDCFHHARTLGCEDIRNNRLLEADACKKMHQIQKGELSR